MKILMITDNDPAGMGIAFTNAINRFSDHSCRLITTAEKYGLDFESDIHLPEIENDDFGEIEHLLTEADIIHFHVLKDEHSHLGPLVIRDFIKGKKIIHHHHGHPDFIINADKYNEKYKKLNRQIIVSTPDLLKITANSIWIPNLVPINDVQFLPRFDQNLSPKPILICQSPTRKYHKHTQALEQSVKILKASFSTIELVILEKLPYKKCLKIKRNCHIIFDHMRGWFGVSSLESLSHGKPVIAGLDEWNIHCIKAFTGTDKVPWAIARNQEDLKKELKQLINDPALRNHIGQNSRNFMENHWTEQHVLNLLFNVYDE